MAKRKQRSRTGQNGATSPSAKMLDMLHRIWLAGVGAAVKAQRGAPQLMEDLVEEGARVHSETRGAAEKALRELLGSTKATLDARVGQVKGRANDVLDNLEKIFQTRVHRALTQLGVPSAEEVEALSARVSALNDSVKQLNHSQKPARSYTTRKGNGSVKQINRGRKPTRSHATRKRAASAHAAAP